MNKEEQLLYDIFSVQEKERDKMNWCEWHGFYHQEQACAQEKERNKMPTSLEIVTFELDRQKRMDALFKRIKPSSETLMCQAIFDILIIPFKYEPVSIHSTQLDYGVFEGYNQALRNVITAITERIKNVKISCTHVWHNLPGNYTRQCEKCEMEQNIR